MMMILSKTSYQYNNLALTIEEHQPDQYSMSVWFWEVHDYTSDPPIEVGANDKSEGETSVDQALYRACEHIALRDDENDLPLHDSILKIMQALQREQG